MASQYRPLETAETTSRHHWRPAQRVASLLIDH